MPLLESRGGSFRDMRLVFTSWLAVVVVGLAYMLAVALSGR